MKKRVFLILVVAFFSVAMIALAEGAAEPADSLEVSSNPIVTIELMDGGFMKLELYPEIAPNTVANFITLAESGYYNGLIFHRIIPGFMIQGGDPTGTGTGGPGYAIKGEFQQNGVANELKHERGVISMARSQDMDSAGSQFFIVHVDSPHLDGGYAAFGRVIEGIETVDAIASIDTDANARPLQSDHCTIKEMTVDTKGLEYAVEKMSK